MYLSPLSPYDYDRLEHVEPTMENDQLSFKRVAQTNEAELSRLQGCLSQLIEAAEVLDKEFIDQKLECQGKIVSILLNMYDSLLPTLRSYLPTHTVYFLLIDSL